MARRTTCGWDRPSVCVIIDGELHAFIESPADEVDLDVLTDELDTQLEPHFTPAWFHYLNQPPRNANDKVDIAAQLAVHAPEP